MGSARLNPLNFSIRKEGKGVARSRKAPTRSKVPKPQIPTRLLPSPLQDAFLGGSCPLLRFYTSFCASWWFLDFVATSQPLVTATLNRINRLLQESFPACVPLTSQNILHHELDATRPFSGFSAHFPTNTPPHTIVMHQLRISPATPRTPRVALDPCKARRTSTPPSPDAPGRIRHQHGRGVAIGHILSLSFLCLFGSLVSLPRWTHVHVSPGYDSLFPFVRSDRTLVGPE